MTKNNILKKISTIVQNNYDEAAIRKRRPARPLPTKIPNIKIDPKAGPISKIGQIAKALYKEEASEKLNRVIARKKLGQDGYDRSQVIEKITEIFEKYPPKTLAKYPVYYAYKRAVANILEVRSETLAKVLEDFGLEVVVQISDEKLPKDIKSGVRPVFKKSKLINERDTLIKDRAQALAILLNACEYLGYSSARKLTGWTYLNYIKSDQGKRGPIDSICIALAKIGYQAKLVVKEVRA